MDDFSTYEDNFGPIARRIKRIVRRIKCLLRTPREILVEINWRLGDEIMALPIYDALKLKFPKSRLTVLCNNPDLLIDNPFVDAVNEAAPNPDLYILLRGAPRDVFRLEHYAKRAGLETPQANPKLQYKNWKSELLKDIPKAEHGIIALATGASWKTKRWDIKRWRELAATLTDQGYSVVELGQKGEETNAGHSFIDKTTVADAARILHAVRMLICCDSGLMHLALAAGTRVIALHGPTDPAILTRNASGLRTITNDRECLGCWNKSSKPVKEGVCPLGVEFCMQPITVETVMNEVKQILDVKIK